MTECGEVAEWVPSDSEGRISKEIRETKPHNFLIELPAGGEKYWRGG